MFDTLAPFIPIAIFVSGIIIAIIVTNIGLKNINK
jgi:hypothetical protein